MRSARLEEQDRELSQIEVDEVFRLVRHIRTEVPAHDAVPRRVVLSTHSHFLGSLGNFGNS